MNLTPNETPEPNAKKMIVDLIDSFSEEEFASVLKGNQPESSGMARLADEHAHALLGHTVAPTIQPQFVYSINRLAQTYAATHEVDLDTAREAVWSELVTPVTQAHGNRAPLFLDDAIASETKPEPSRIALPKGVRRPRLN